MIFNGDTEILSEVQNKCIQNILKNKGFRDNTQILVEKCGTKGDNFAANVKRIIAEDVNGTSLRMIAKVAPTENMCRHMTATPVIFGNEIQMYQEILPKLVELQKSSKFSEQELLKFPECYGVVNEVPNELILLEDLSTINYEIRGRQTLLKNDEVKMILRNLAVFHSLSYALRKKEPGTFKRFETKLIDVWEMFCQVPEILASITQIENGLLPFLDTDEQRDLIKGSIEYLANFATTNSKQDVNNLKYAVIVQGDCWSNNILFKLEDGHPLDCILVDYQLSRSSSPVTDIQYMMFNCTDYETRSQHYFDWIDHYYKLLEEALYNFNLEASFIYPREQLDADLNRYGRFTFGLNLILTSIMTRESENILDLKDYSNEELEDMVNSEDVLRFQQLSEESSANLKKRILELIKSFSELGYIELINE